MIRASRHQRCLQGRTSQAMRERPLQDDAKTLAPFDVFMLGEICRGNCKSCRKRCEFGALLLRITQKAVYSNHSVAHLTKNRQAPPSHSPSNNRPVVRMVHG
jgi:hypothetical protein